MLTGKNATLVQHCSVFGRLKTVVRESTVRNPRPYAQHPISVTVGFVEPRKRKGAYYIITPNGRYLTIERDGEVLYDSRADVPCDMTKWTEEYRESRADALRSHAEFLKENAAYRAENPDSSTTISDMWSEDKWPEL